MTAAVETMAYAREVPWHGLGEKVSNNLTPAQMLKAAGLDWLVSKRELWYAKKDGEFTKALGKFAHVREDTEAMLSVVGATYKSVQNELAMNFFKRYVMAGHMTMETAGSLWDGRYIWALARVGKDFALNKTDKVQSYLLLSSPHVIGKAMAIQFTPIRVVCWNTLTLALGSDLKGKKSEAFRMPHSVEFNDSVKEQAEQALGLAKSQMEQFKEAATLLCKTNIKTQAVNEYFFEVLKLSPEQMKKAEEKAPGKRMLAKFQAALTHAPGHELPSAAGTLWGAFNAVTYVIDHETGRNRSASLHTAWMGQKAALKRRALSIAIDRAA